MASDLFSNIIAKGIRDRATFPAKTDKAREWYRDAAKKMRQPNQLRALKDSNNLVKTPLIGNMYFFNYDAKHKDTLPYWDMFPLVFPIEYYKDGFLGINLHYLPPVLRAKLMDGLYEHVTNNRYDVTMKMRISYPILKGAANLKYFKPCVKRYLYSHVKSKYMYIYPSEWEIAAFLPMARFQKRTQNRVYADSVKMINS